MLYFEFEFEYEFEYVNVFLAMCFPIQTEQFNYEPSQSSFLIEIEHLTEGHFILYIQPFIHFISLTERE